MFNPLQDPVRCTVVRRVLVTKLRHHGDVLLASPVFTVLSAPLPAAEIDALVYRETAPMLEGHPAIAQLHTIDREWKQRGSLAQARAERRLLRTLRARRYDLIVHLTEHPRGAGSPACSPALLGRPGSRQAHWLWRTTSPISTAFRAHASGTWSSRISTRCGASACSPPSGPAAGAGPGRARRAAACATCSRSKAWRRASSSRCIPGSRWLFKCWPPEHTAALLDRIVADGLRVAVTGAPDARERALVDAILAACAGDARAHRRPHRSSSPCRSWRR